LRRNHVEVIHQRRVRSAPTQIEGLRVAELPNFGFPLPLLANDLDELICVALQFPVGVDCFSRLRKRPRYNRDGDRHENSRAPEEHSGGRLSYAPPGQP
jgi:hypothetical protein